MIMMNSGLESFLLAYIYFMCIDLLRGILPSVRYLVCSHQPVSLSISILIYVLFLQLKYGLFSYILNLVIHEMFDYIEIGRVLYLLSNKRIYKTCINISTDTPIIYDRMNICKRWK